eukprot:7503653-Ditylum_brightwellii.AAC.1
MSRSSRSSSIISSIGCDSCSVVVVVFVVDDDAVSFVDDDVLSADVSFFGLEDGLLIVAVPKNVES